MSCENPFGETIYSYSRTQAIEDGVLVDLSHVDSIRQHWKHPFACTATVWGIGEEALQRPDQDSCGICHDISTMAKLAIRSARDADQILFTVIIAGKKHAMKLHIGPGDTAATLPRRVTSTSSPLETHWSTLEWLFLSSRTVVVFMCYNL